MATRIYDWVESPGTSQTPQASVTKVTFGDGYVQRTPNGINPIRQIWSVVHNNIDAAIADDIDAFLKDGLGWKALEWTPPRQTLPLTFVCTSYSRSMTDQVGIDNINATFEQDFRP